MSECLINEIDTVSLVRNSVVKTCAYPNLFSNLFRAVLSFITKMSNYCFICTHLLTEGQTVTVNRGMKTLINASIERDDGFSKYLIKQKSVTIHEECRKNYTRKCSIAALTKRKHEEQEASTSTRSSVSPPRTRSRLSDSAFSFKKQCLFCGNELNENSEKKIPTSSQ